MNSLNLERSTRIKYVNHVIWNFHSAFQLGNTETKYSRQLWQPLGNWFLLPLQPMRFGHFRSSQLPHVGRALGSVNQMAMAPDVSYTKRHQHLDTGIVAIWWRFSYYTLSRTIIYRVRSVVSGFWSHRCQVTAVFFCSRDPDAHCHGLTPSPNALSNDDAWGGGQKTEEFATVCTS